VRRIAIVNDVAGVARLEVAGLREAGLKVDFYELPRPGARWPPWAKVLVAPLRLALAVPVILRLRRGGYDLVHVHFVSQGFAGAASGRPYFLHAHGSDVHQNLANPLLRAWSRLWMRRARGIFYVTPNLARFLADYGSKARLLPNPVDTARYASVKAPERLGDVLVFVRLAPIKGADTIFAVADQLTRLVSLAAISWGPLAVAYRHHYGDRVAFLKAVSHDKVRDLLAKFDAVIGQMGQGVPGLSELEAMAAGRVVLMRIDTALFPDDAPPVVNVSNGSDIVTSIEQLQGDRAAITRLSHAGREWVQRHHGLDAHVRALVAAYRDELVGAKTERR
jgi:glycosyltransferase involved in cell wall biosynthesis